MLTLTVAASMTQASPAGAGLPDVCGTIAERTEVAEGIPPGLIRAVTLVESGRWLPDDQRTQAWPWTVTAGPNTFYLPTKRAALEKVEELQASGRSNIDVGCMQINLGYHGDAFASLEDALDPARNIAYGAKFLKQLRLETRSWARATALYHSSDPDLGQVYRAKVYRRWHELRRDRLSRPVRVAGTTADGEPEPAAGDPSPHRRLLVPTRGAKQAPPGAIAILRGQ
jgi:hypothetical protein